MRTTYLFSWTTDQTRPAQRYVEELATMKISIKRSKFAATVFTAVLWSAAIFVNAGSTMGQQNPAEGPQTQMNQAGPPNDPIRQLNLTVDQAAKIRAIREGGREERAALNRRFRQAQQALDDAIEADNASEALIEQRARELAEAQVAVTRMRALTELRIRRVMTPEQLDKLRALRQQALTFREQRQNRANDQARPRERIQRRRDALQGEGTFRPGIRPQVRPGALPPKQRP